MLIYRMQISTKKQTNLPSNCFDEYKLRFNGAFATEDLNFKKFDEKEEHLERTLVHRAMLVVNEILSIWIDKVDRKI